MVVKIWLEFLGVDKKRRFAPAGWFWVSYNPGGLESRHLGAKHATNSPPGHSIISQADKRFKTTSCFKRMDARYVQLCNHS